jgi:hypothetical protein
MSTAELAREAGTSEPTVRRKLGRLRHRIEEVAQTLSSYPMIETVAVITGPWSRQRFAPPRSRLFPIGQGWIARWENSHQQTFLRATLQLAMRAPRRKGLGLPDGDLEPP